MKKIFKKITWLSAIMTLCLGLGAAASCGGGGGSDGDTSTPATSEQPSGSEGGSSEGSSSEGSSSEEGEAPVTSYSYRVSVQNPTDYGMGNITVHLVDELKDEIVATETTNSSGFAYFTEDEVPPAEYLVVLEDITPGYQLRDPDIPIYTPEWGGETIIAVVEPTGELRGDEIPSGTRYSLGDVMHDFTVTTAEGKSLTLSTLLETKEVVLLNFWATWCGPCEQEFPAIDNSIKYEPYDEKAAVIAISVESSDTNSVITQYKTENGLELDMVSPDNDGGLIDAFYSGPIPLSVMIDRYGVITFMHTGSMTEAKDFQQRFDYFLGEDYEPYIIKGDGVIGGDNQNQTIERVEVPQSNLDKAPTLTGVANVLGKDGFTYRWQKKGVVTSDDEGYDKYSWPWYISENNEYLVNSNQNYNYSYATLYVDFVAEANTALAFDYKLGSEEMYDEFIVLIDGVPIHQLSGNHMSKWNTCYAYVFRDFEAGEHEMTLIYNKNTSKNVNGDTVQIKNLRFETVDDMISAPGVDANVFRHAASVKAAEGAATQFERYITPVYNEVDGYYHVESKDGPLLFANLWYSSLWCTETSLWMLAYNNFIYADGLNYKAEVEYYAWEANNNLYNHGYTPVTKDLMNLLDLIVECVWQYNAWTGEYHENEWLELCVYYDHYGDSAPMQDPMRGISYQGAIQVYEGDNKINVPFPMTPRGFKHKFIPETSGIYDIRSTGESDTLCWLVDSDRKTFLGTYDNPFFVTGEYDYNFNFRYYMEAGKTYYLLMTYYNPEEVGSFNLNITKSTDETYSYFEHASLGQYSFNEVSGETFLTDGIAYTYSEEDGFYHVVNSDGSIGSYLYLDVNRPTPHFYEQSIYSYCLSAENFEIENRTFYVDGVDYTPQMLEICERAMENEGKLEGFIAVDKEIYDLLNTILLSEKHKGVEDTWLCSCYYERVLAEGAKNPTIPTPFL